MDQITVTQCPEEERIDFLPQQVKKHFLTYENTVFSIMDKASPDYQGGFWQFYSLSNGGFFMAPDTEEKLNLKWDDNYFEGSMSAKAAGIGVNIFALSAFAFERDSELFGEHYHHLREYAMQHKEAPQIMSFID